MSSPRPRPSPRKVAPPAAPTPPQAVTPPPPVTPPPVTPAPPAAAAVPPLAVPAPVPVSRAYAEDVDEYTERLVVPTQIALGAAVAVVAAIVLVKLGLWPLGVIAALLVAVVAWYLGVQTLAVSRTRVSIGQGRGDNSPHTIELSDVASAEVVTVSWAECFGIGVPDTVDTTRFTVRAGPTLALTMRDGELVRISAADPAAVVARLAR